MLFFFPFFTLSDRSKLHMQLSTNFWWSLFAVVVSAGRASSSQTVWCCVLMIFSDHDNNSETKL